MFTTTTNPSGQVAAGIQAPIRRVVSSLRGLQVGWKKRRETTSHDLTQFGPKALFGEEESLWGPINPYGLGLMSLSPMENGNNGS